MSKAYYQKQIIDLRARIAYERDVMKRENENYARLIKGATSASAKASYRKSKIDRAEWHKRTIASLQKQIATAQYNKARASK